MRSVLFPRMITLLVLLAVAGLAGAAALLQGASAEGDVVVGIDADTAGNFSSSSEAHAAAHVTSPFTAIKHYCVGSSSQQSDCPAQERDALYSTLFSDWNRGGLLLQFTGHSSWQQWAIERFFHLDDLDGLNNDRRWPIVVEMTCFTSTFHRPEPTLDASLVRLSGGGVVAT